MIEASGWSIIEDPKDDAERKAAAGRACAMLRFPFPVVVDTMDDAVAIRWSGWPERLFLIDADGIVRYVGAQGPWGFWPLAGSEPYGWGEDHGFPHGEPLDRAIEALLGGTAAADA
jgi:hypothetical protein